MDVSKYSFSCQKALHTGFRYAKSYGHPQVEVEHVALGILKVETTVLPQHSRQEAYRLLQQYLAVLPRHFGRIKIEFGIRITRLMANMEGRLTAKTIDLDAMWPELVANSTALKTILAKINSPDDVAAPDNTDKSGFQPMEKPEKVQSAAPSPRKSDTPDKKSDTAHPGKKLLNYTVDLTELAARGELDPVIGRDKEVKRVIEILGRKKKNNPILLGEPGVGKSAIADALAIKIVAGNVPEPMKMMRVLALDLGAILAGAKYRGEFEERLKGVLNALIELQGKVVLFIDEIHMLIGAGNPEGGADAANLLKPALARGDIKCLGATTLEEYARYIEKDQALERRFQQVMIEEPSQAVCLSIMRGLKEKYEIYHGVKINDEAISAAVVLSTRFIASRKLPDKAIDLIDEACSRMRITIDSVPNVLDDLRNQVTQLEIEKQSLADTPANKRAITKIDVQLEKVGHECNEVDAIWRKNQKLYDDLRKVETDLDELNGLFTEAREKADFEFAARLQYMEIPDRKKVVESISVEIEELHKKHGFLCQIVGEQQVSEIVSDLTGIPVGRLMEEEAQKLSQMELRLATRVFGQNDALSRIAKALRRNRMGISDQQRPIGVFLFLGPTGVGKTETAKAVAAELFDDASRMIRIDMTEYMEQHSVARLIGAPPGYVGYGNGGELSEAVRQKPYQVVLLDEIEKAHPRVLDILLQIFEDGRLTDGKGRTVNFKNVLIIMTSNLKVPKPSSVGEVKSEESMRKILTTYIKPELINRIDEIVVFNKLARVHLEQLIERYVSDLNTKLQEREMRVTLGGGMKQELIAAGFDGEFGGRAVRRYFQQLVIDVIAERLLILPDHCRGSWILNFDKEHGMLWQPEETTHRFLTAPKNGA